MNRLFDNPLANIFARFFTDENLRRSFWENPEKIGHENGLNGTEISQFKEIVTQNREFFASSLFNKRLNEVEKLLPLTKKHLDNEIKQLFRKFAHSFQPKSNNKHLEDALKFVDFLQTKSFRKKWLKDIVRFEQARLIFFGVCKPFVIRAFAYNVRKANEAILPKRFTIAVWFRFARITKHLIF